MKKFRLLSLLLVAGFAMAALLPVQSFAQKGKFRRSANGIPDQYIVVLNPKYVGNDAHLAAVESEAGFLASVYGGKIKRSYSNAVKGFAVEMSAAAAAELSKDDRVAFVEQDGYTYAEGYQTGATWGLDRLDQRALPLDTNYGYSTDASNVHAYIIDSGIRTTHVEFGGRATKDYDAIGDGQNGNDCLGHGTHVAGTVGSSTWGVAKNVRLHAVRVLPCTSSGTLSALIAGIDWVKANHIEPAVANISITASGVSSTLDQAVQNLVNSGVTVAVAAGNSNLDACNYSPGRAAKAITVGATYNADQKGGYSNWGSCLDIWAPGTGITSVSYADDFSSRVMSGTSMASPHVAGVAALYLATNPSASPSTVAQNILDNASNGIITGIPDTASPNKLLYSWFGGAAPAPSAARVTIKKRANTRTEAVSNASFPYDATNLSAANFTLQPNNQFDDVNVSDFGSANMITVTEEQVYGWALTSISCVETAGGSPNVVNSTVDLAMRSAKIIVEPGEQVECTFTSEEIAPSASYASITGKVVGRDGRGVRGVAVTLLDATTGAMYSIKTNSFGYYKFSDLEVSHFYTLTATSSNRFPIADNVRSFSLTDDYQATDFVVLK